jgi:phosphohistidine phosphatase
MKLYLLQHGEAVSKQEDPERPLSEHGEEDVRAVAAFLDEAGIKVSRVWHSGKRRAEQTAEIIAKAVLSRGTTERIDGISPNDPVVEFATDADVWSEDTLVVGHLPFMSRLVSLLTTGDADTLLVQYQPGSLVGLERVNAERWVIIGMIRPDMLPE